MAMQDSRGLIRGVVGNLVFRVMNGKQVVQQRSKVDIVPKRTLENANLFGICSKQAAIVRTKLKPWLGMNYDSKMPVRLQAGCYKILKSKENQKREIGDLFSANLSGLSGFEFNVNSPFSKYFISDLNVSGDLKIGLKVYLSSLETLYDLRYPKDCESVDLHLIMLHIPKGNVSGCIVETIQWTLLKNKQTQEERSFQTRPIQTEGITLVIAQLLFFNSRSQFGKVYVNNKKLHPMKIVYAR
ncbi:hypothetical protein [Myroides guanonis]|uniref:Uncharacterized protein n=1 Tax=Myroides guanonis TaxID=1150112 RepID=A0A1I3L1Y0_9FLAO|nr:hypothetical protein [Myroides guanonis]SFI78743.1 hypothetical protein SAMN04487893_101145 [Myroides guanonis]